MKKRLISSVLCVALLLTAALSSGTVFAAESDQNRTYYTSEDGTYTAAKISHPENGIKAPDGIVNYIGNGTVTDSSGEADNGDRAQSYSWSAVGYGDYIYIGTCANAMTNTLTLMKSALGDNFDEDTMKATLNAMFNGHFFVEEEDGADPKGVLLKVNIKTGDVKLLMSKATTGTNCLFRNAVSYNDMLYFCGSVNGIPSIYQVNPKTDEAECVYSSMTLAEYAQAFMQGICVGIRGMCVFNDKLIVSLIGLNGAYICETDNPSDTSSYKIVADMDDLFNYPAYHYCDSIYGGSIWDMIEYNNSLYVSVCTGTPENKPDSNSMQSFALVRADVDENGNWTWTSVAGDMENYNSKYTYGIDPERTRSGAANLMVYGDYLYIGEYNDEEIALEDILFSKNCNFVNANLAQSVNLYRMNSDEEIELVVGDADEMFPEGSLTGFGSGFDRHENQYIWRMQVYNNKLYIGTFDTSSLLEPIGQFTNGDLINMTPEEWESQLNYISELLNVLESKKQNPDEDITLSDIDSDLTKSQRISAVSLAGDENAIEDVDEVTIDYANEIRAKLEELKSMISDNVSQEFLDKYQEILAELTNIVSDLPQLITGEFEKLISEELVDTVKSFIICGAYMSSAERGFDIYVLDEDLNVDVVTTNGFGDPYNHGCRVFAVSDAGLSIGTANPFYGTQVWSLEENVEYDMYDVNRDGNVNILDATFIQKVLAGLEEAPDGIEIYGDINDDGNFNILDSTEIQYYLAS